jgi:hypothetical protein
VKPEFGFVAARMDGAPRPGETRPPRSYTSRVYFDRRHAPERGAPNEDDSFAPVAELCGAAARIEKRYSHYGELVVLNHGPRGRGFEICPRCGFGRPAGKTEGKGKKRSHAHRDPRTGRECGTHLEHRHLGHDFITDVLELRVTEPLAAPDPDDTGKSVWLSTLYALLEGTSAALEIRRDDLNGTLYTVGPARAPTLVLYDDVPGGAGHVRRVAEALPVVFAAALRRAEACGCGPETACHECLWNYYNQPFHARLARGLAAEFLRTVLAQNEAH